MDGYPGEIVYVCARCEKISHADFDIRAVI